MAHRRGDGTLFPDEGACRWNSLNPMMPPKRSALKPGRVLAEAKAVPLGAVYEWIKKTEEFQRLIEFAKWLD